MSIADDLDAQAEKLEKQAAALREAARLVRQSELPVTYQTVTLASNDMPPKNNVDKSLPPKDQLSQLRWSIRRLAAELAKPPYEIEYSHVHLGRFIKGEAPAPSEVRAAIYKLTGVRI